MKTRHVWAAFLLLCVAACAPLQQAPLVYSSGQVVGIRVGAAPTQPDAVEMIIGVKILDAAYVPVAVSRPEVMDKDWLEKLRDKSDLHSIFAIKEIYGIFGEELTPESLKKLNDAEIKELQDFLAEAAKHQAAVNERLKAFNEREEERKRDADAKEKVKNATAKQTEIDAYIAKNQVALGTACPGVDLKTVITAATCSDPKAKELGDLLALVKEKESLQKLVDALPAINLAYKESKLKEAEAKEKTANDDLLKARKQGLEALQKLANVRKKDALSVFGSFDANANAEKEKAGLKVGKLFSTGVAAQNLTEAAKISATASALSQCVAAVTSSFEKVTDDTKRKELLLPSITECGKAAGSLSAQSKSP